jgi:hypothetical protein
VCSIEKAYGGLVFCVNDNGVATSIETNTGALVWRERLGGLCSASPIHAGGRLCFFDRRGTAAVLEAGREFRVLATSDLDEELLATPAIAGEALFIRTAGTLYRIEGRTRR